MKPNANDLFATLVRLLAEQESVTITYDFKKGTKDEKEVFKKNA